MLWIDGVPVTVPTEGDQAAESPYVLAPRTTPTASPREGVRLAAASRTKRPRYYDLQTADGVPYWKIALLHLDSLASTVVQTCAYWGNADQCKFCGIEVWSASGRTIVRKKPQQLAEVAVAAKELDGAVDATLTTGSSNAPDRGARYVARCGDAVEEAAACRSRCSSSRRAIVGPGRGHDFGIDSVGIHVETFDPAVLAHVAPGKARTGIDATSAPGNAPSRSSAGAGCRPTSSSAWARTRS